MIDKLSKEEIRKGIKYFSEKENIQITEEQENEIIEDLCNTNTEELIAMGVTYYIVDKLRTFNEM